MIPIENFIEVFDDPSQKDLNLKKSIKLLDIIKDSQKVINLNSKIIERVNNLIQSMVLIFNYNSLLRKRELLTKELEISKIKKKSSDIAAKTDLLNKLNESLIKNKKKFNYTKEDFLYLNNKRNQIISTINDYKQKIQELNKKKKDCFSQINRIIREMSDTTQKSKQNDLDLQIDNQRNYSKAEAIKTLQKQAKDFQYEINQLNSKINESQLNLDQVNPSYKSIEKDYNKLLNLIKNDENRLNSIKNELKDKLIENEDLKEFDISEFNSLRSKQEIENEITDISDQLNIIINKTNYLDRKNPEDLSKITKELTELNDTLNKNFKDISIPYENNDVINCIENFRRVEILYSDLEDLINKFLLQINLETYFQMVISENFNNFFIKTSFLRSKKESLNFEELTTPEKIYFVITFYISVKIILHSKNIIFSNLFVPNEYNKRGSIYRTIDKIIPIFEQDNNLKNFNLIFLISNLEMKKKIENIKIIKINEN